MVLGIGKATLNFFKNSQGVKLQYSMEFGITLISQRLLSTGREVLLLTQVTLRVLIPPPHDREHWKRKEK